MFFNILHQQGSQGEDQGSQGSEEGGPGSHQALKGGNQVEGCPTGPKIRSSRRRQALSEISSHHRDFYCAECVDVCITLAEHAVFYFIFIFK